MEESLISDLSTTVTEDIREYSPLTLAFIGDGVYELFVRTQIVKNTNAPANQLHKRCVHYVRAQGQCVSMDALLPHLTEQETDAFKRGRNAKINTKAKNAGLAEYKKATGFEALIGYLYVSKQTERLEFLMQKAFEAIE
ncbi:MAG: ribonuclease III [Clostridia bacterium]|nr:ribonuclease III [Clostridia bacterium]